MKSFFIGLMLLAPFFLMAQQHQHQCGSFDVIKEWERQYPGTQQALDRVILDAQMHGKAHDTRDGSRSQDTIYRIPVVVHILYTTPAENLPDSLVFSQIEVLNQAFRRNNPDSINTRSEFLPFAGDAGIEFYLADTDPQGNPTTGITRKSTTQPAGFGFSAFNDGMKKSSQGGTDAWPTDRYLNIWVCDINSVPLLGTVLGYAYPPVGNLSNWPAGAAPADTTVQGVVIYHKVFGRNNPLATADPDLRSVALGKSCVHEVGHYLGLRHIWGEDASNPFGTGSCALDDFVDDTPPTINRSEQACDLTKNECPAVCPNMPDLPDMIENYMDYSVDSCNNMFTYGQIQIMRGILALYRPRLGEVTYGTIRKPVPGTLENTFVVGATDSVLVTIDYSRWLGPNVYPYNFYSGDSLISSVSGDFVASICQQFALYGGDFVVNPNGDTLYINFGDTVSTYSDGTIEVRPYREAVGIASINNIAFSLFPNPAKGQVQVAFNGTAGEATVTVANLMGQTIITENFTGNHATLNLQNMAMGIYLVQLKTNEGMAVKRLVIE